MFLVSFDAIFCLMFFLKQSGSKSPVKLKAQRDEAENALCVSSSVLVQLFGKHCKYLLCFISRLRGFFYKLTSFIAPKQQQNPTLSHPYTMCY